MKKIASILISYILAIHLLSVGGVLDAASNSTRYEVFPKRYSPYIATVPSSLTSVTVTHTAIFQFTVANTCGAAVTFLVQDRAGTPKTLIPTVSIAANTVYIISWPEGAWTQNGFKWQAGTGSCLDATVNAFYQ